jgi:hypothetical protein
MHDWLLYQVASEFGSVYYDDKSHILYRQHDSNVVGMRVGLRSLLHRTRTFLRRNIVPSRITQAKEFLRVYGEIISNDSRIYLSQFIQSDGNFLKRLFFAVSSRPRRASAFEDFISLVSFVFGR